MNRTNLFHAIAWLNVYFEFRKYDNTTEKVTDITFENIFSTPKSYKRKYNSASTPTSNAPNRPNRASCLSRLILGHFLQPIRSGHRKMLLIKLFIIKFRQFDVFFCTVVILQSLFLIVGNSSIFIKVVGMMWPFIKAGLPVVEST